MALSVHGEVVDQGSDPRTDPDEFAELYAAYAPRLRRYCSYRFGPNVADEIVQQTMERAFEALPDLADLDGAWPWLRVVARNIGINLHRRVDLCVPIDEMSKLVGAADRWSDPHDTAEREERRACVAMALARLSEGQQRVLVLRVLDELPMHTVAELLGTTENAVRQQLFKARKSFVTAYSALGGRSFAVGPVIAGWLVRFVRECKGRSRPTIAIACASLTCGVTLGYSLPSQQGDGALGDVRVSALEETSTTAATRVAPTRPWRAPARVVPAPGPELGTSQPVQVRVSRHPLAQGEVAAITVKVTTPVGTVYYRDRTVNGAAGPVCTRATQLCT